MCVCVFCRRYIFHIEICRNRIRKTEHLARTETEAEAEAVQKWENSAIKLKNDIIAPVD